VARFKIVYKSNAETVCAAGKHADGQRITFEDGDGQKLNR